jgi:hypothetical protein
VSVTFLGSDGGGDCEAVASGGGSGGGGCFACGGIVVEIMPTLLLWLCVFVL